MAPSAAAGERREIAHGKGESKPKPEYSAPLFQALMNQHTAADELFFHGMEARVIKVNFSSNDTDGGGVVPNPEV